MLVKILFLLLILQNLIAFRGNYPEWPALDKIGDIRHIDGKMYTIKRFTPDEILELFTDGSYRRYLKYVNGTIFNVVLENNKESDSTGFKIQKVVYNVLEEQFIHGKKNKSIDAVRKVKWQRDGTSKWLLETGTLVTDETVRKAVPTKKYIKKDVIPLTDFNLKRKIINDIKMFMTQCDDEQLEIFKNIVNEVVDPESVEGVDYIDKLYNAYVHCYKYKKYEKEDVDVEVITNNDVFKEGQLIQILDNKSRIVGLVQNAKYGRIVEMVGDTVRYYIIDPLRTIILDPKSIPGEKIFTIHREFVLPLVQRRRKDITKSNVPILTLMDTVTIENSGTFKQIPGPTFRQIMDTGDENEIAIKQMYGDKWSHIFRFPEG